MKKRSHFKKMYYGVLSTVLTWLGFSSCFNEINSRDEYGAPYATHQIKGKVVKAENESSGLKDIQVIVKPLEGYTYPDTLLTDQNGDFFIEREGFSLLEKYKICYEENIVNGDDPIYKKDSIIVETDNVLEKGKKWYKGKSSAEVLIKLQKKEKEPEND